MNRMHLWGLDLNLLVVLDVLLQERSVTRAAARLGRTQSAVSHALERLREALGDELLVRDGRRMVPTARALGLAGSLPRALDLLAQGLSAPAPFAPGPSDRVFRLAAPDFFAGVLPELLAAIAPVAPRVRVELVAAGKGALRDVADGRTDGLIAPPHFSAEGLRSTPLGASRWAVFGRRDHPAFRRWSAEAWQSAPHLQVRTMEGGPGPVDQAAARAGLVRTVGAWIPSFAMAPAILARTDLLFTAPAIAVQGGAVQGGPVQGGAVQGGAVPEFALPEGAAPQLAVGGAELHGLAAMPPPFELPPMPLSLHRSAVVGQEPDVAWFLAHVERVGTALLAATG